MQEIEFRVLCANDGDSCSMVRGLMSDFQIAEATKTDDFDHKGVRQFNSLAEAERRVDEIRSKAGKNLRDITLHVRR